MKILETIFFFLMFAVPGFFIILGLLNMKSVKKNKRFRNTLIKVVLLSFVICGLMWGALKMSNDKKEINNDNDQNYKENNNNSGNKVDNKDESDTQTDTNTGDNQTSGNRTSKGYKIENIDGVTYIDGYLVVNKTYPLPKDYVPTNTYKAVENASICPECIDKEAYSAYTKMKSDMASQGLNIWIASGYRSYTYQNGLYTSYVKKSGQVAADTYSARAGHSEHQSGFAFDLNSVTDAFANTKEGIWVNENCYKYGFIIRYPKDKDNETGYKYESWHLRYVGTDLASKLYNGGDWITMETYFGITSQYAS